MYGLYLIGLHGSVLLYAHTSFNSDRIPSKNESTLLFGDVEPYHGSYVIAGDLDIHSSAPDILRMMASLGFRSFLDNPTFRSIEIDMQDTIILMSNLPVISV